MFKFLIKRILNTIPTIIMITIICFVIIHSAPGDIVTYMIGLNYDPQAEVALRHQFGLDKPLYVQYFFWLKNVLCGNLGTSSFSGVPVLTLFLKQLPITLFVSFTALIISFILSTILGIFAALKKNSILDYILSAISLIGISVPDFWICIMTIGYCRLYPDKLFFPLIYSSKPKRVFSESLICFILPIIILVITTIGPTFRLVKTSMLDVLKLDYITNARSKGLGEIKVVFKHGFRNALIPFITHIGLTFPTLITGTFIIETIFKLPGVGKNYIEATFCRDYPYLMGALLLISFFIIIGNILADVLYALADPRIKYN